MGEAISNIANLILIGGAPCLDFVNTVDERLAPAPDDRLRTYADLITWSERVGILSAKDGQRLLRASARPPRAAQKVVERAIALREAIYRIFSAQIEARPFKPGDLSLFNEELSTALAQSRLTPAAQRFKWDWRDEEALDQMLWPIVRSAAELLTSDRLERVRRCANQTCGWLFLDTSRSGRRHWCDMRYCGNRAKARRHYARVRGAARKV